MKKLLMFVGAIFISTFAMAHTINWHIDDQTVQTTTCANGDNITPPTAPTKRGYDFQGWNNPYAQLEYIESTGTQWIDTGLTVTNATEIQLVGNFTTVVSPAGNVYQLFGVDDADLQTRSTLQFGIHDNGKWFISFGNYVGTGPDADTNEHTFVVKKEQNYARLYIDGTIAISGIPNNAFTTENTFLLFRRFYKTIDSVPCWSWFKMKRFKMYDNGILVRDMIPAKRDGVVGMYDAVSKQFFTNAGTGDFIGGPVVDLTSE